MNLTLVIFCPEVSDRPIGLFRGVAENMDLSGDSGLADMFRYIGPG